MSKVTEINDDFLTAFKAKQTLTVSVLRLLKTALTNKAIEQKIDKDGELSDEDVLSVIKSEMKKRKDSYTSYTEAGRDDLASQEEEEMKVLEKYLPEQMSEAEVKKIVEGVVTSIGATGPADFGKVMGATMAQLKGQADGDVVSLAVKDVLSK